MKKFIFKNWFEDEFQIDIEFNIRKNILIDFSSSSVYYWIKKYKYFKWQMMIKLYQVNENSNSV